MGASTPNIAAPATPIAMTPIVESAAKSIMRAVSSINVGSLGGDSIVSARTLPQRKSSTSQRDSVISGTSTSSLARGEAKDGSVIELSQELTPLRPLRPENESKNRPPSSHLKQVRTLTVTPSTSPLDNLDVVRGNAELPPPLPEKSSQADYANIGSDEPSAATAFDGQCLMRRGTHKDRPHIPLPTTPTQPLPPKKSSASVDSVLKTCSLPGEDGNTF